MIFNKEEEKEKQQRIMHNMLSITICLVLILMIFLQGLFFNGYVLSATNEESTLKDVDDVVTDKPSPSFSMQEIIDPDFDWIIMKNSSRAQYGDNSTDIESVEYYSDGKMLNATLWLYFPFQVNQSHLNEEVNYGMYIDADFDKRTGYYGIDYKYELHWDSLNEKWTRVIQKWSHFGNTLVLDNQTISYTNFSKKDSHYVRLSADLDAMLSPERYNVVFYAEARREGDLITDLTRTVAIPPLEVAISQTPSSVEVRRGETKTIEVKVNTSQGYEPTVNLTAGSQSDDIILDFTPDDTLAIPTFTVRIPSYGFATMPLTIRATDDATIAPVTLFIVANSSFPLEELIEPSTDSSINELLPYSNENIFSSASSLIMIREPLTLQDRLGLGSSENAVSLNIPQEYLVGFYVVVLTFLIPAVVRWYNRRRQGKQLAIYMRIINSIYDTAEQNKGESTGSLEQVRRQIASTYAEGKIGESDYKILNEKISEYEGKIKGSLKGSQSS